MRWNWITITVLIVIILFMFSPVKRVWTFIDTNKEGMDAEPDPSLECRDPDTNLKITDAEITKDAKNLIINQGIQAKKLYTENGRNLTSPKVADHILVEVMGVRKRPIYEKYPACEKQLAKSLKHELSGL